MCCWRVVLALCVDGGCVKKCVKDRKCRHFSHPHFVQLEHFTQPPRSDRTQFIFLGFLLSTRRPTLLGVCVRMHICRASLEVCWPAQQAPVACSYAAGCPSRDNHCSSISHCLLRPWLVWVNSRHTRQSSDGTQTHCISHTAHLALDTAGKTK